MTITSEAPAQTTTPDYVPVVDIPLSDAVQELNGFEALGIEARFKTKLEEMGGIGLTIGVVWAYENRDGKKRSWSSVQHMTFKELTRYFAPEPDDIDESEPDSDTGKDD